MDCLIDYILLRPCGYTLSKSGLYLDQLPGIDVENIDALADSEQITYQGVWNDLQATASATFSEDIISEFNKRYQLKQITQTIDIGKLVDDTSLDAPIANTSNGMLLETSLEGSPCAASNLQKFFVQEINFYWKGTNIAPEFTLTFQDADTRKVEYTITVSDAVAGWNNVWIDMDFNCRRLYVLASGNFDDYVKLDISQFNLDGYSLLTWGMQNSYLWFNWTGQGCQSRARGVQYNGVANQNILGTNTFGLSPVFSVKCSFDSIVCANKKHFASAWQHCLAIELMNYRINSDRINKWTTIKKEQAIKLQELFTLKYRGGVDEKTGLAYPGKLQNAITSLVLNDSDCCLKCNDYLIWRESQF